jgi:sortase (surface protein transpeptidase)
MRPAAAGAVLGLALAVGVPTAWELTRPSGAAGAPVSEVLTATPPEPGPAARPPTSAAPDRLPTATTRPAVPSAAEEVPAPIRLAVPALGVDTTVDPVGVAPDGQMEIPEDVDRVGWYRFGPAPGEDGSAVLAGHVDDAEQGLGVLATLRRASVGDEVRVTDDEGTTTRWRVVSREVISKQALPLENLFRRDGPPRLTLITCGGPFLPEYRSYRDNVIVVAEPLR